MQQESDSSREHITSLEEQFDTEKRRREDIEIETNRQKQVSVIKALAFFQIILSFLISCT